MRLVIFLLMLPILATAQTVHIKDKSIVYEGKEKLAGLTTSIPAGKLNEAVLAIDPNLKIEAQSPDSVKTRGELKLKTPYHLIRTVQYSLMVKAVKDGYEYCIDSVLFTERERGEKPRTKSSKEVLENIGETGKIVGETEKILNETDMRFQKILALLKTKLVDGQEFPARKESSN